MEDFDDKNEGSFADDLSDDTFIPDFSDTHDEVILEDGIEVQLRVISVDSAVGPKGPYKRITYEIIDEPFAKAISNVISMPNADDEPRKRNKKQLRLRSFLLAHGLPIDRPFSWNDLIGVETWAVLGVELSDTYGDKNTVKKYTKAA